MTDSRTPVVSRHIGRFELLRPLGEGAQAAVWLANDPRLQREVALKLLHDPVRPDKIDTWLHEARAVSRLTHPNIVPVFEADVHDGQPYLVFEYVVGETLLARMKRQRNVPAREAVELMLGVLGALALAHDAAVVHRDLKPSNILLEAFGRARVMDFGIAARTSLGFAGPVAPHGGLKETLRDLPCTRQAFRCKSRRTLLHGYLPHPLPC